LAALAEEFRQQRPYPTESDKGQIEARAELREALSRENLEAVELDPSKYESLKIGKFAGSAYGGPGPQAGVHRGVIEGGDPAKSRLARSLRHLLYDDDRDEVDRIDDLLSAEDWRVFGLGESLAVKALAVVYPEQWLPAFVYAGDMGKKRIMQVPALKIEPLDERAFRTVGQRAVESNRRLREVLEPLFPEDPWAQVQFAYWLRFREADERPPQVGLQGLADELLLDLEWLSETVELLRDKRQIIFYGPPGTGKTYVARKLAEYIAQDPTRVEIVQFHPSYAYEDFVEGYRPTLASDNGAVSFELRAGPLRRLAESARESEADWCLVIDEINRGNIAKVFGELYYLLEYRGDEIRLQYGDNFRLPSNLYIIATMNTADRSIALLDAALRRRFHFVAFFPDQPPIDGLLRRWLSHKRPGMEYVADLLDKVNGMLPDRHLQIGPSHFMTPRLDDEWLEKIWRGSVLPYIEEQFFDEPERVDAFRLERIRSTPPPETPEGTEDHAADTQTTAAPGVDTEAGSAER
jgi:5-methylcytosine-specific restriction protein B